MDKIVLMVQKAIQKGDFGGLLFAGVLAAGVAWESRKKTSGQNIASSDKTQKPQEEKKS